MNCWNIWTTQASSNITIILNLLNNIYNQILSDKEIITFYILYVIYGYYFIYRYKILKGKLQYDFFKSTLFLILIRVYIFSLYFLVCYYISKTLGYILLLYLPLLLTLNEFKDNTKTNKKLLQLFPFNYIFTNLRIYTQNQIIKTIDININNLIIAIHPHAFLPFNSVFMFGSNFSHFEDFFPNLSKRIVVAASLVFMVPLFRNFCLLFNVSDCSRFNFEVNLLLFLYRYILN